MNFFEEKIEEKPQGQADDQSVLPGTPEAVEDGSGYAITSKSSNRNTYVLLTVCVLAIVGVWLAGLAHKKPVEGKDSKKSEANQLDIALARLVGAKNSTNSELLVNAFYELPGGKQVKLDELNKNPFVLQEKVGEAEAVVPKTQKIDREKKLTGEIGSLRLNSIMKGPDSNFCMINGVIYKEGDAVTESFKIKTIEVDKVVLEADEYIFQLEM